MEGIIFVMELVKLCDYIECMLEVFGVKVEEEGLIVLIEGG